MGYRTDMIVTACDYLRVWCGDEDKAFESFVSPITMNYRVCVMLHAEMTLCDPNFKMRAHEAFHHYGNRCFAHRLSLCFFVIALALVVVPS